MRDFLQRITLRIGLRIEHKKIYQEKIKLNQDPLSTLRDVHIPPAVSWWPVAPGWWFLMLLVLGLMGLFIWYLIESRNKRIVVKQIKLELEKIEYRFLGSGNAVEAYRDLSILIRRMVLTLSRDPRVGGLKGDIWIGFLNHLAGSSSKALEMLVVNPYKRNTEEDPLLLMDDMRKWIKTLPNREKNIQRRINDWFKEFPPLVSNSCFF